MQPQRSRHRLVFKVAQHRVLRHQFQLLPRIALGDDVVPYRCGVVAAFLSLVHFKNHFVQRSRLLYGTTKLSINRTDPSRAAAAIITRRPAGANPTGAIVSASTTLT